MPTLWLNPEKKILIILIFGTFTLKDMNMKNQNNHSIKSIIRQAIMEAANSKQDYEKLKVLRKNLNLDNQLKLLNEAKTFFESEKYAAAAATIDPLVFATKRLNEEIINILKVMNRMELAGEYDAASAAPAQPAAAQKPVAESLRRLLRSSKKRSRLY